jgi:hypothetical protein
MSSSGEAASVTLKVGDEGYDALRHDYLEGLWERIVLTGDGHKLASLVREGGDLGKYERLDSDYRLLDEIAVRLDGTDVKRSNRGGPKDVRNLTLYLDVCNRLTSEAMNKPAKKDNVRAAIQHVCSIEKPDVGADYDDKEEFRREVDKATKQFNKGMKLFIQRFGRPWRTVENNKS